MGRLSTRSVAKGRVLLIGLTVIAVVSAIVPGANAYPRPGRTERVSVATNGTEGDFAARGYSISANGRYVAFASHATTLVPGDTNKSVDVFVRDRVTGSTERVSVAADGAQANWHSDAPAISPDGRYVAFTGYASNLVAGDPTRACCDLFVKDLVAGSVGRLSLTNGGGEANGESGDVSISEGGRFVSFRSLASNLVPGDTNGTWDVFVHDSETGETERVSVASDGTQSDSISLNARITPDGRYVVFAGEGTNLVPGDTNDREDVFVHDRETQTTERFSVNTAGVQGNENSFDPSISADGRFVSFWSSATNLVAWDDNGSADVFVRDLQTGVTERVSVTSDGGEADSDSRSSTGISADGRYVAFHTEASNLVADDWNTCSIAFLERKNGHCNDVFIHDRKTGVTERVSVASDGAEGNFASSIPIMSAALSADGRYVTYWSQAWNLVPGDTNRCWDHPDDFRPLPDYCTDVFVRDRGPDVGVGDMTATPASGRIDVSGWATFTGALMSSVGDPDDDGEDGSRELGGELTESSLVYRPEREDLLVRLRVAELPGRRGLVDEEIPPRLIPETAGAPGVLYGLELRVGQVDYEVRALRTATESPIGSSRRPPAAPAFFLYRCDPGCSQAARLSGGYGTTGPEIVTSVPLAALGAREGDSLTGVRGFSAIGEAASGALAPLDEISLADATIPKRGVDLGVAPPGTPEGSVSFDVPAELEDGEFRALLDSGSLPSGQYEIWAKACLGEVCGSETRPGPVPSIPSPSPPSPTEPLRPRRVYPAIPHDTYFADQWAPGKIKAPDAWREVRATGLGIKVAVVDTGVDLQHEDLQCPDKLEVLRGSNLLDPTRTPDDDHGAGTHAAGIIGACANNSIGTVGVAPDATIMPFKVLSSGGGGSFDTVADAVRRAANEGAHVINLSVMAFGPVSYVPDLFAPMDAAIEHALSKGAVVVAAAGEHVMPLCQYPAIATDVVCVGATDNRDLKAWSSSFPAKPDGGPAVVAPGGAVTGFCDLHTEEVLSLWSMDHDNCDEERPGYSALSGTGSAAPHVSGVAALVYDRLGGERTEANARRVVEAITTTADDLGAPGFDPVFGSGRVNALAAVRSVPAAPEPTPSPPPTPPTPTPTAPPSPTPTGPPETRFYFHSAGSRINQADRLQNGGATFDTTAPASEEASFGPDTSVVGNTGPEGIADPTWKGGINGSIDRLTVDFWQKSPVGEAQFSHATYNVTVFVDDTAVRLPTFTDDTLRHGVPSHVTHVFTKMLNASNFEIPLSIDAAGKNVTIAINGRFVDSEAFTAIVYDSVDFPSGFSVTLSEPAPTPTPSPTGPAETFTGEGTIQFFNPLSPEVGGVTENELFATCDPPPLSQGVDGFVFEIPATLGTGTGTARVTGSNDQNFYDLDLAFYTDGCSFIDQSAKDDPDETAPVPAGTRFVVVNAKRGLDTDVVLTVTGPGGTASPSPTMSPTPTPTGSPSRSPSEPLSGQRGSYPTSPNDQYFSAQWGPQTIEAPDAWQEGRATGFGVKVAVLDSGVDLQHEDLQCPGKLGPGESIIEGEVSPGESADDVAGHGTHVAGIIGACTNNNKGTVGVAPDATILPYRVFSGDGGSFDDIAIAVRRAADAGAHVINMSLGPEIGPISYVPGLFDDVDAAIEYAVSKGVVIVAAAGNDSTPLCEYPALATDVVCVGATDPRDLKAWYSTFPNKPDGGPSVVAPGGTEVVFCDVDSESILSLYPKEHDGCPDGKEGYRDLNGTSMAAPHVAGVAALVYDRLGGERSETNAKAVVDAIVESTDDLGVPGYDPVFGFGRVNALKAVRAVGGGPGPSPSPTESPTATPTATPTPTQSESPDPGPATPEAPSNLTARAASSARIELSWNDNSVSETGFAIERSADGSTWQEIDSTGVGQTSYLDTGLDPDTTYFYRVRAFNSAGHSPYSNVAGATTPARPGGGGGSSQQAPAAPSQLAADEASSQRIELSWRDNSSDEDGFAIERSRDGSSWQEIATTGRSATTYLDVGLQPGTTYSYRVRAYNSAGHSFYSNVATATTKPGPGAEPSPSPSQPVTGAGIGTATTTLAASRGIISYNSGFELVGEVTRDDTCTGPLEVEIRRRDHGTDTYEVVASTPVSGSASWGLHVAAAHNGSYVATVKTTDSCEGAPTGPVDVLVRAKIKAAVPRVCAGTNTLRGRVLPNHRRTDVILRHRGRTGWRKMDSDRLNKSSRFVLRTRGCGLYRIVWPKQDDGNEKGLLRVRL